MKRMGGKGVIGLKWKGWVGVGWVGFEPGWKG